MLIEVIHDHPEKALLELVEQSNQLNMIWSALHFKCAEHGLTPTEDEMLIIVRLALEERNATLYCFDDGDVIICWQGAQKTVYEQLESRIYTHFKLTASDQIFKRFDLNVDGEEIRQLSKSKLAASQIRGRNISHPIAIKPQFEMQLTASLENISTFNSALYTRHYRSKPEILIVEDQNFSASLLKGMLARDYKTYAVPTAREAWKVYLETAPDIVFLDIELPEMNGHDFARHIKTIDKNPFIVMVTANNYIRDVAAAKENGAQGFIVKPYNKQKIIDSIAKFQRTHNQVAV